MVDRDLILGDSSLNPTKDKLRFVKIIRHDFWRPIFFGYDWKTITIEDWQEIKVIENSDIETKVDFVYKTIIQNNDRTFRIYEIEKFMDEVGCIWIKKWAQEKSDLYWLVIDPKLEKEVEAWFSIKSSLWWPSTLLNASMHTNFKFTINWVDQENLTKIRNQFVTINNDDKTSSEIKKVIKAIQWLWWKIKIAKWENSATFENNLLKIDSKFVDLLWEILVAYYGWVSSKLRDILEYIAEEWTLDSIWMTRDLAILKVKQFLLLIASEMMPGTERNWFRNNAKGYIVIKQNWDLIGYYIYNEDEFAEYMFENMKLDTPSTSRYGIWVPVEETQWEFRILLNLQLRFLR